MQLGARLRTVVLLGTVALLAPGLGRASEVDRFSRLKGVALEAAPEDLVVRLSGSRSPDVTTFTLKDPPRVIVDWAGSVVSGAPGLQTFERGLVRKVSTQQ